VGHTSFMIRLQLEPCVFFMCGSHPSTVAELESEPYFIRDKVTVGVMRVFHVVDLEGGP
jgi:hypothetical protein